MGNLFSRGHQIDFGFGEYPFRIGIAFLLFHFLFLIIFGRDIIQRTIQAIVSILWALVYWFSEKLKGLQDTFR